jgi:hypothetical protein
MLRKMAEPSWRRLVTDITMYGCRLCKWFFERMSV